MQKLTKIIRKHKVILAIIVLASVLRFFQIAMVPPSLNWDEISHGYNAYSILKTGKDEWGNFLPIIFRAYGDYKLPVYIYLTVVSEFFLGLNALSVRLVSILAGIGTVVLSYFLAKEFFRDKVTPLLAALLVAVSPWTFFLSRGAFEANLALFFIVAGIYCFYKGLKKTIYYLPSAIFLGLSVWTYNSARVFTPLILVSLAVIYWKELKLGFKKHRKNLGLAIVLLTIFLAPMFAQLAQSTGQARYSKVTVLDEGAIAEINESRRLSGLNPTLNRLVNNKATYLGNAFVANWLSHYSPEFLFFEGGSHFQFSTPGFGLIYLVNFPFLFWGIALCFKKRDKVSGLLLAWLVLGPVASSFTREAPHVLRAITILPVLMFLTALGLKDIWSRASKKKVALGALLAFTYFVLLTLSVVSYFKNYFTLYPSEYSWSWQYGHREVAEFIEENYEKYDKIVMTKKYGEPHEFMLFYLKWEPSEYQKDENLNRFYQTGWYWVDSFDKFFFINDWQVVEEGSGNFEFNQESGEVVSCSPGEFSCLLVTSPGNVPEGWELIQMVNFLDNETAFELYEN